MAEKNYTIPINEIFEVSGGCPICRMTQTLEQRYIENITGAAMMEPDIRIRTNQTGFCTHHFEKMSETRQTLSVALIMESHLKYISEKLLQKKTKRGKPSELKQMINSCYVCEKIQHSLDIMIDTMCKMWIKDEGFRSMYTSQEYICLDHFDKINTTANSVMKKTELKKFDAETLSLTQNYLMTLHNDVEHFCRMYDYRNASQNADWGNSKGSVERAIHFIEKK